MRVIVTVLNLIDMMKPLLILGGALAVLFVAFSFLSEKPQGMLWAYTDVPCLPNGHQSAAMHIHSKLTLVVDDVPELIPSGIGDTATCMAEVHTHDASGSIHIESAEIKQYTMGDFFAVWGKSIEREGYNLTASVSGVRVDNPSEIALQDNIDIVFAYRRNIATSDVGVEN